MGDREYSITTIGGLFATSVKCYYPNCPVLSVNIFEEDDEVDANVQIAHICAVRPDGPRYDASLTKGDRNNFKNLILLCKRHHHLVDKKEPHKYTVSILKRWKQENEKELRSKFRGLDDLTEERLQEILNEAAQSARAEIRDALDELKDINEDAAHMLRGLYEKIERYYVDQESIALLHAASERLYFLEEGSVLISGAAQSLGNLEENAGTLARAADGLNMEVLESVSRRLEQFTEDYASLIRNGVDVPDFSADIERAGENIISDLHSSTGSLVSEIDRKVASINHHEPSVVARDKQRWKFASWGFVGGVISVMVTVIVLASTNAI